jgi:hypothetical protein
MGIDAEGVDEGSQSIVVGGEDDGEGPLAKLLVKASHRGPSKMLAKPLLPKCWWRHVIVVHIRCL